jgi:acetyl-CoA carboxylase carboxyl transferase subunit beta
MSWFRKPKTKLQATDKRELPGDVWEKCPSCGEILYTEKLRENWNVCPACGYHLRLAAGEYVRLLLDADSWAEQDVELQSADPMGSSI